MTKLSKSIFPVWFALLSSSLALPLSLVVLSTGCGPKAETIAQKVVQPVNPDYFIADSLVEPIKKEMRTLSDGSKAECYVITTKSVPPDHQLGPWAPKHVTDGEDKGGIWIKDGHVNPHAGYHYHAATGKTKEIAQADGHAPLIGYALDGFGIYAHLDKDKKKPNALDECSGHYDDVRGYHYHAGAAGDNQIIGAFRGIAGSASVVKPE